MKIIRNEGKLYNEENLCYLPAAWEVRIAKTCDRGLENADRGQKFSLYGPTLSW